MSLEPLSNDLKLPCKTSRQRKDEQRHRHGAGRGGRQSGRIEQLEYRILLSGSLVVTTPPPTTITAGQPFGMVVTDENADETANSSFNGSVTVGDGYNYPLGGTLTVNAVSGVATFSGLTEDTPGTHYLYAASSGLTTIYTSSFTVAAAPAAKLVAVVGSPVLANGPFGASVFVEDQYGNLASTFGGNVTLKLAGNPENATLGGTVTVQPVNGIANFSGLTISKTGVGYTLQATSTGLTADTSSAFNVTDQLVVTTQPPANVLAGSSFSMSVTAEDGLGTVDSSFSGSVTVSDPGFSLGGSLTVTAANGVAAFSGLTQAKAGSQALYANSGAATGVFSNFFTVTAASATRLVALPPSNVLANGPFSLTVDAEDPFGNIDPTYNGNVTVALAADPGSAALGGTLTVPAANGVASFSGLTISKTGFGFTLQESSSGLAGGTTASFNVTDQLVIMTQPPSAITAGSPFNVVVAAEDGQGNVDTSFSGTVTVESSLGGIATLQAVNGVAAFLGLTQNYSGTGYYLVESSGLSTVDTSRFTVTAAPATKLFPPAPSGVLSNGVFNLMIDAVDPFGNIDSTFSGNVTLAIAANPGGATLGGTLTVQAVNGVAMFSGLTISRVGSGYTLQASSPGLTTGTTVAFNVYDNLVVMTEPPANITAGSPFGLVIAAEDGQGNIDTYFGGTVKIADAYGVVLGGTVTVPTVNGVASFSGLTETPVGSRYLTASTSAVVQSVNTSDFTVIAAPATKLVASSPAGTLTNGPFGLTVDAEDPFGNIDPAFNGNVTLSLAANPSSATLGGTLTVPAVNGVASLAGLTINKTGSGYTLQATNPGLTAWTSAAFNVTDKLAVTTQPPPSIAAGVPFSLVVTVEDGQGNVDTSFAGTVTVADSGGHTLYGTLTATAVNGLATFQALTETTPASTYLNASSSGVPTSVATRSFTVTAAPATTLALSTPSGVIPDSAFSLAVSAEDPFGNIDPTFNGSVTLALAANPGSAMLGGTLTARSVNGRVTFSGLTINEIGTGYTVQATSMGLAGTTATFNAADKLVVTTQPPTSMTAGTPFGFSVVAENGNGVDGSFTGSVTVADPDDYTLGGTLTVSAVNGVAAFSGLTVDRAISQYVSASGIDLTSVNTNSFTVTAGSATKLGLSAPLGLLANATFILTAAAEDPFGNRDTTYSGNVTIALAANPGSATLGGTLTEQAYSGLATFPALTINKTGSGYTLQAASPGLTTGTTAVFNVSDQLVVTTQPPASITAGVPFGLVVTAKDGRQSPDASFSGSLTVADSGGYPLGGTLTANAVNGVATFSGLTENVPGARFLKVTSSGLNVAYTNNISVTAAPAVTSLGPVSGPTAGGTSVVITGTNFTGATAVTFGSTAAASFTVNSATQITAVDPMGAAGVASVLVTTPGGTSPTSAFDQFTYIAPPTVVSVTTNDGEADGNTTQASEVRQLVVNFSQAVTVTQPGAFSLGVYNLDGTGGAVSGNGANDRSITDISSVLNTATTTNGGLTWTITFAPGTSNTDASASLIDGIYSFSINNSDVTSNGVALTGSNTYTFHRLYGDVTGTGAVNNTDARDFSQVYGAAAGSANYNAAFDFAGTGANINNTDARDFSLRYGQTFSSVLPAGGIN